jgi:hypothetical protein
MHAQEIAPQLVMNSRGCCNASIATFVTDFHLDLGNRISTCLDCICLVLLAQMLALGGFTQLLPVRLVYDGIRGSSRNPFCSLLLPRLAPLH